LWDALRKGLGMIKKLNTLTDTKGWRNIKSIYKNTKSIFRNTSQQVFRGKNEKQKKQTVQAYLHAAGFLHQRFTHIINHPPCIKKDADVKKISEIIQHLQQYNHYIKKQINLVERRLIKGEKIEASEKIHSIFEDHTEWINKGKMHPSVELGHLLLLTTDQHQFIVDYKIMQKQKDAEQVKPLLDRIKQQHPHKKIYSHSFDKGFYSKDNYQTLQQANIENIILPKKGKLNQEDKQRESEKNFKTLRNKHSAIESNINMLEHHGLNRCVDKGLHGYKRYVGLSVLAYNLHILGNHLITQEIEKQAQRKKWRERYNRAA